MTSPALLPPLEAYSQDLADWFKEQPEHEAALEHYSDYEETASMEYTPEQMLLDNIGDLEDYLFKLLVVPDYADAKISMSNLAVFPGTPTMNPARTGYLLEGQPSLEWLDAPHHNGATAFHRIHFQMPIVNFAIDQYNEALNKLMKDPSIDRQALKESVAIYSDRLEAAITPLRKYLGEASAVLDTYIMRSNHVMDDPDASEDQKMRLKLAIYCDQLVIPAIHAQIGELAVKAATTMLEADDLSKLEPNVEVLRSSAKHILAHEKAGQNPTTPLDEAALAEGNARPISDGIRIRQQQKRESDEHDR